MDVLALPYVVLLAFLWGSTLVVSRFSVGQFEPTTYIGIRLLLASLAYVVWYTVDRRRHWPTDRTLWKRAILAGAIGTAVPMTSIVTALVYLSSGLVSIMLTTSPAITVVLAHFFLKDERLSWSKLAGVILAMSGGILLILRGENGLAGDLDSGGVGYALVSFAMLVSASFTIFMRRFLSQYDAVQVSSIRMFSAAMVVMPLSLILVGFDLSNVNTTGYGALGYAGLVGTFAGMYLSFYVVKRFGATPAAMVSYVIPVITTVVGALVLDEQITSGMLLGMGVILAGITLINRKRQVTRVESSAPKPSTVEHTP